MNRSGSQAIGDAVSHASLTAIRMRMILAAVLSEGEPKAVPVPKKVMPIVVEDRVSMTRKERKKILKRKRKR